MFLLLITPVYSYASGGKLNIGDTTVIKYKTIAFDEANLLLIEKNGHLNNKLSRPNMSKVFNLNDGTMLVIGKKACFIYNSESDLYKLLSGGAVSEHILYHLNYYGKELPIMIDNSKIKVAQILNIDVGKLDYSEQSLGYIDHAIMMGFVDGKVNNNELLANVIYFITYSGQVFNNQYKGKWLMVLDGDGETWQPYNTVDGKRIDLFTWVYSSLCELGEGEIPSILSGYYSKTNNFLIRKIKNEQ